MNISKVHHIAIICSNYKISKEFYTKILGFEVVNELYREERNSYKLDLRVGKQYQIELFSFPNPPKRQSFPEAAGLRHLAFAVTDIQEAVRHLNQCGVDTEPIRVDEITGRRFVFFQDPDCLPLELYED
ncbi:VOC family protein [Bacillus sp. TL12]|uniref:SMU1112c/YaeR family gloxylase I-like metalloprotein n=1 Tax=Bacillus TaxID=1386 RepID=UPI001F51EE7B|nr:VOC family protein [Bacillus sp. TL12]